MRFTKRLAIAACLPLWVAACGKEFVRESPPAEALVRCPDPSEPASDKADVIAVWAGDLLDLYFDCAAKHDALREWHK